jgi:hypothetical protein
MHEHVSNHLPDPEIRDIKLMHSLYLSHHWPSKHERCHIENDIDDEQILNYCRNICEWVHS